MKGVFSKYTGPPEDFGEWIDKALATAEAKFVIKHIQVDALNGRLYLFVEEPPRAATVAEPL